MYEINQIARLTLFLLFWPILINSLITEHMYYVCTLYIYLCTKFIAKYYMKSFYCVVYTTHYIKALIFLQTKKTTHFLRCTKRDSKKSLKAAIIRKHLQLQGLPTRSAPNKTFIRPSKMHF